MGSEAAAQFNIHEAKTNLSRIIERVEHGEEIVISRAGQPVAKVIPLVRRVNRTARGSLRGKLVLSDDWDAPEINETIADDFGTTA
ncbi:type II toxin-antitoxin system prevent-host-death family antitoxin [Micromonospora zingiberis]|uniref:Antitoxin n=1 Tax=Micromonospora zingiberis TaxID=2053011 RepID=A0A4V2LWY7_9ACTN|nr:type II toxin-antitoxin system prevent-host-death family antitoxin [Micromonospora zingiberis]TCB98345.1 type II toxin-antitoxin system prevent-host-death family antitoxin [Micromonospora zingiberis]